VIFAREKYEVDKVLEIDDKVKELKKTHEWFLELASLSPEMREQLRHGKYHRLLLFCSSQILFNISNKILQNSIYPV
jgi:hypothetical protein